MRRALVLAFFCAFLGTGTAQADYRFAVVGKQTEALSGWIEFCKQNRQDCTGPTLEARAVVYDTEAWHDLDRVNRYVNDTIKPVPDHKHWGVADKWSYPDDGYGDCEDYVLLKRRMLMDIGFPRQALLVTYVLDKRGEGHAVLTVKTHKGDYVLDNQQTEVMLWVDTAYRFIKRQSQEDPNQWVSLSNPRKKVASRR